MKLTQIPVLCSCLAFLALAALPALGAAEREEPGLHACNHVIDGANHKKLHQGLVDDWKKHNCDNETRTPPVPRVEAKCTPLHRPATYNAAYENTELTNPRVSPLLSGRVHRGDMQKHCGGANNQRGDRNFLANNVRQLQGSDGKLPGGAELLCVCKKKVDPTEEVGDDGKPRNPLTVGRVDPPPSPPAVPSPDPASASPRSGPPSYVPGWLYRWWTTPVRRQPVPVIEMGPHA